MYKLFKSSTSGEISFVVKDNSYIPFDPDNTDYQNFKYQINHDEAQLETAEGVVMTSAEAKAYVATLP